MERQTATGLRPAIETDDADFFTLLELSSPHLATAFGQRTPQILKDMFRLGGNLFGFDHVEFAESDGRPAGMLLGYDWNEKRRENLRTGLLILEGMKLDFLRMLPSLVRSGMAVGIVEPGEFFVSNIAVYGEFRGAGAGRALMESAEARARAAGASKMSLEADVNNAPAVAMYKKMGFAVQRDISLTLDGHEQNYHRMVKTFGA